MCQSASAMAVVLLIHSAGSYIFSMDHKAILTIILL